MGREESVWRRWGRVEMVGRVEAVGGGDGGECGDVRYGGVGM